ncbi:MAG: SsrA-binding protein SmpB [Tissierellia bacterium]|jgi:SsrA-binding protein|nr:SsrA-binding protein SmpB [Tissierellia bacterium]
MKYLANNKKAFHEYHILEKFEAGMVLEGNEVKSIRQGKLSIQEAYVEIRQNEAWIVGMNVTPYEQAGVFRSDPVRARKLLLHRREINQLYDAVKQQGVTIVPLSVYLSPRGHIKLEIGLAKGKKLYDKRESQKERDTKRYLDRYLKTN